MAREHLIVFADADVVPPADAVVVPIRDSADVPRALDAALAGHRVMAVVHRGGTPAADEALADLVTAELRRVGPGVRQGAAPSERPSGVSEESSQILGMLASGLTIGQAARRLGISARTATRRIEQARAALGVATTAEAVAVFLQAQGPGPERIELVGRDEAFARLVGLVASDTPVVVSGEGAVGKTAMLTALGAAVSRPVHRGGGQATLGWVDFWAVAHAAGVEEREGDVEAVAARVERAVGPGVLVVDDVHLADAASVSVLCALTGRVAMAVAARPLGGVVERLTESGFVTEVLEPLGPRDIASLARRIDPGITAADLDRVVAGAGGLPLLVEFLCRADPHGVRGRGLVPVIETLSPGARRTALRLAVADRALPPDDHAGELTAAGIAVRDGEHVRVRHALVADAVRSVASPTDVRRELEWLGVDALGRGDRAAAAAYAGAAGDPVRATDLAVAAAEDTSVPGDRAHLLAMAARWSPQDDGLRLRAVEALSAAGRHREVLELAGPPSGTDPEARARLAVAVARAHWHLGNAESAVTAAREGLQGADEAGSPAEAALIRELVRCQVFWRGVATEEDAALLARAGELARRDGYPRAAQLSVEGIVAHFTPGETDRAAASFALGRELARDEGDLDTYLRCTNNLISSSVEEGDAVQAAAMAAEMAATAAAAGLGEWRAQALAMSANLGYHRGNYASALADLEELDTLPVDELTRLQAAETRAAVLIDLGMLDEARAQLPDPASLSDDDWLGSGAVRYLLGAHAYWSGQPRRAVEILAPLENLPFGVADRWFAELIRAWARFDLGEPVTPPDGEPGTPLRLGLALQSRAVALLAADPAAAVAAMDEAAEAARPWTYAVSRTAEWGAAEAARLAGRDDAVDRLLSVEKHATEAGLECLLAKVRRSLRLVGVRRSARRSVDRSGLVTERERMVIDLLAQGATYDEIARRLGVGRSTVRRLLANAQAKLGSAGKFATVAAIRPVPERP